MLILIILLHMIIMARELGTGKSRYEVAAELGLEFEVAPKLEVDHGIESVRNTLPNCWFDRIRCKHGIESLKQYKKFLMIRTRCLKINHITTGHHMEQMHLDMVV